MKKLLTLLIVSMILLFALTVHSTAAQSLSVEYSTDSKSLHITGAINGNMGDAVAVFVYNYDASTQGVADASAPKAFDAFALGQDGNVDYKIYLDKNLIGGKYVICISTSGGYFETTFMHINDDLASIALSYINSANSTNFANALAMYGPACGLDPDEFEANSDGISRNLLAYRKAGFSNANDFFEFSQQAIAATLIKNGNNLNTILDEYGAYLKESDLIDCKKDFNLADDNVKQSFKETIKAVDFANEKGFCQTFRQHLIYKQFEAAQNWAALRDVLEGTKDGKVINNNPDVLNLDKTTFSALKMPDEVYKNLYLNKAQVVNYNQIASLFKTISDNCLQKELNPVVVPSRPSGSSSSGRVSTSGMPGITPEVVEGKTNTVKLNDINGHWAQKSIECLVRENVISGYEDGSFKPDNPVTRAEFVKLIVTAFNLVGESDIKFSDVTDNMWHSQYIKTALSYGLITGYEDGTFNPDSLISREDTAVIVNRVLKLKCDVPEGTSEFNDISEFSDYALRAILDLAGLGLINGTGEDKFSPKQNTTRAQSAVFINNALEYVNAR